LDQTAKENQERKRRNSKY